MDLRPPHVKIAVAEREYAQCVEDQDFDGAVRCLVMRAALLRVMYGETHPKVARAYLTVGRAYFELKSLPQQAFHHAKRALEVYKERARLGLDRAEPAASKVLGFEIYLMLGTTLTQLEQHDEAGKAIARAESLLAELTPDANTPRMTANLLHAGAQLLAKKGDHAGASEKLKAALQPILDSDSDKDELLIVLNTELSHSALEQEKFSDAVAYASRAHKYAEAIHGKESLVTAQCLLALAKAHMKDSDEDKAEVCLCESLKVFESAYTYEHPITLQIQVCWQRKRGEGEKKEEGGGEGEGGNTCLLTCCALRFSPTSRTRL